jgi:putative colanic acid biosynthesis acetyltransferase WcaF
MPLVWKPIVIGDNCWIASHCFISPGVEIADGAIAAARSVITRNVAAWTIVGGNPAKIIREREMPTSLVAIQE